MRLGKYTLFKMFYTVEILKNNVIIFNMRRIFAGIIITAAMLIVGINYTKAENQIPSLQLEMRGYNEIKLPSGTFIPVINLQGISTETCPQGFKVKFQTTDDLYIDETNILPRGSYIYGYIEKINEPIVGTNASMKIKLTQIVLSDGYEIPIRGYIYNANDNTIGGELTEPSEYVKMPHYQNKFQGISWNHRAATLQIRPGGKRAMGKHTTVNAGERLIVVLSDDANITHTAED